MRLKHLALAFSLAGLSACQTNSESKSGAGASESGGSAGGEEKKGGGEGEEQYVSGNYVTLTYSLSNNSQTSKAIQISAAKELASDLEGKLSSPSAKDKKELIALMAAKRLSGDGISAVFAVAKKLMIVEMRDDIRHQMPDVGQLELALASIHSKQFPMAEHWIDKLMASKNDKTKAAALTARGMIAMLDNRLPEAVAYWNEAIAIRRDYEPARLNIGFTALRFGDARTAKAMLTGLPEDYFVQTGLMQAERLLDNPKEVQSLCESILSKRKNYKPALFSCALNEYQGLGNFAKARTQLEEVAKLDGGPTTIDEKAYLIIGKLEREQREQQLAKDKAAAASKAAATPAPAAGAKPAPGAAPAAPPAKPQP